MSIARACGRLLEKVVTTAQGFAVLPTASSIQIVWFKRHDLRVTDHEPLMRALWGAEQFGPVVPLYIHESIVIDSPFAAYQHQQFTWECLDSLRADLESIGGALSEYCEAAPGLFERIHQKVRISRILAHRETSCKAEHQRDRAVRAWARQAGVVFQEISHNNVPRGSEFNHPQPEFQAYLDAAVGGLSNPLGENWAAAFHPKSYRVDRVLIPRSVGVDKPKRDQGGRLHAVQKAKAFFTVEKLLQYPYSISSPNKAFEGCSRLSAYLSYGVVSDRHVLARVNELVSQAHAAYGPGSEQFQKVQSAALFYVDRLIWRQGYFRQFEQCPGLEDEEFFEGLKGVREQECNSAYFQAWVEGRTGLPFVDAVQRCLDETGWVNMRARACLASFATMQLWLPWPLVAQHLARQFTDFCWPIHMGQIRIASGSSHFSQLLAYNPVRQSQTQDPQARFIKRWVPELRAVDPVKIHEIWKYPEHRPAGYPEPIVDHEQALEVAKVRVHQARQRVGSIH